MFEKHKYKILVSILVLIILGGGAYYYFKKQKEKKAAALEEEKRKKLEAGKKKNLIKDAPAPQTAPKQAPELTVVNTDKPIV